VRDEFFSVLLKSEHGQIQEVYRIRLPGNPLLGEGKPENQARVPQFTQRELCAHGVTAQNHAIVFTRGALLQTIDMNQCAAARWRAAGRAMCDVRAGPASWRSR
jgi:callose synthase